MSKPLNEQLRAWVSSAPKSSVPRGEIAASSSGFSRDMRNAPDRLRASLPTTLLEAEVRRAEVVEALADIDRQLAESSQDEDWRRRATTARRGYEYEMSRLDTCVRVFQREQVSDKAAFAVVQKERDDAVSACHRLAGEVERLTAVIAGLRAEGHGARTDRAFVDVAHIILSEVTFNRILDRAKERG